MRITSAYSFLVHPSKGETEQPKIGGTKIPLESEVGILLSSAFLKARQDCSLEIVFAMSSRGTQENIIREAILELLAKDTIASARKLAEHLQLVTTNRSGLGLFFVLTGKSETNSNRHVYLARFPADNGIVAEEDEEELTVDYLEQVFMKSAYSYKAAVYEGSNVHSDFREGRAVDKQVSNKSTSISGYWIKDFLRSDFKTTSDLGTRRFAKALKETIDKSDDIEVKQELTAVATLAKNFNNKVVSVDAIGKTFKLSEKANEALTNMLQKPEYAFSRFQFSAQEFKKHLRFRQLELSNGAVLTAPAGKFDQVFERTNASSGETRFSTKGKVIDETVKKGP